MFAAKLPTVSAKATDAPPCRTPVGWCVVGLTGMVAQTKSGPISVTRIPMVSTSVSRDSFCSCSTEAGVRQMVMKGSL